MDGVFRVADPWGRVVVLTLKRWTTHVVPKHPELTAFSHVVTETVEAPTQVFFDRLHRDREVFYCPSPLPAPLDRLQVRVVVAFDDHGRVVTAHLIKQPHRQERQKWP